MKNTFNDFNLSPEILRSITDLGYEEPSPIQQEAIPVIMTGVDVMGQAQTGTGKTAAFGIPTLEKVNPANKHIQALILCPTRELAIQVAEEFNKLLKHTRGIQVVPVYGGQPMDRQLRSLKRGAQVVIGTPGRTLDHIRRGSIDLGRLETMVLDEADEMLNMGFKEDLEAILENSPATRQTILFSATMPDLIQKLARKYQKNPKLIKVVHHQLTVPAIEQTYFEIKEKMKLEVLSRLLDIHNPKLTIVFCNTRRKVDEVVEHLLARGYLVDGLHGEMKQAQRDKVMNRFRAGKTDILVATDVASRGIDVENVEMVVNYDVPQDEQNYVHRIGRTGRAGRSGRAFTFASGAEIRRLRDIQRYAKVSISRQHVPSLDEVEEIRASTLLNQVRTVLEKGDLEYYIQLIEKLRAEDNTALEIAAALLQILSSQNANS